MGDPTDFGFGQIGKGEQTTLNLFFVNLGKEIGLVFALVECLEQIGMPIFLTPFGVMAHGNRIEPLGLGKLQKGIEFDVFVAEHIGVWSSPSFIFL